MNFRKKEQETHRRDHKPFNLYRNNLRTVRISVKFLIILIYVHVEITQSFKFFPVSRLLWIQKTKNTPTNFLYFTRGPKVSVSITCIHTAGYRATEGRLLEYIQQGCQMVNADKFIKLISSLLNIFVSTSIQEMLYQVHAGLTY